MCHIGCLLIEKQNHTNNLQGFYSFVYSLLCRQLQGTGNQGEVIQKLQDRLLKATADLEMLSKNKPLFGKLFNITVLQKRETSIWRYILEYRLGKTWCEPFESIW
jgi:hypothetical protein